MLKQQDIETVRADMPKINLQQMMQSPTDKIQDTMKRDKKSDVKVMINSPISVKSTQEKMMLKNLLKENRMRTDNS